MKVIINSIYPVASHYNLLKYINNENICRANTWLVEVAEQTGARFLNSISILMGNDGWLPYDYQNGDGLHLSPDAFRLVLDYIPLSRAESKNGRNPVPSGRSVQANQRRTARARRWRG